MEGSALSSRASKWLQMVPASFCSNTSRSSPAASMEVVEGRARQRGVVGEAGLEGQRLLSHTVAAPGSARFMQALGNGVDLFIGSNEFFEC